jgi:hypothetical protein
MTKKDAGITREHAVALEEILSWAKINPAVSAFEIDVLGELLPKLHAHTKNGAILRVRQKNMGNRPATHTPGERAWSEEELDLFRNLYRGNVTLETIANEVNDRFNSHRTYQSCQSLALRLGMRRPYIRAKGSNRPERDRTVPTESQDAQIELLWKREHGVEEIAAQLGLTPDYVDERIIAIGLLLEIPPTPRPKEPPKERRTISTIHSIMERRRQREARARREEIFV